MIVIMHRPPLSRIEIGAKPRVREPKRDLDRNAMEIAEHNRVWNLLRQSAEGCNAVGAEG